MCYVFDMIDWLGIASGVISQHRSETDDATTMEVDMTDISPGKFLHWEKGYIPHCTISSFVLNCKSIDF